MSNEAKATQTNAPTKRRYFLQCCMSAKGFGEAFPSHPLK